MSQRICKVPDQLTDILITAIANTIYPGDFHG